MKRKITYEIIDPSESKKNPLEIIYGIHKSPFGWCVIGITGQGVCTVAFINTKNDKKARDAIFETWPNAKLIRNDAHTKSYVKKIFGSKSSLHLMIRGTPFQIKVWKALADIPIGTTKSYADIARSIKSPQAVRAVGSACGRNSIAYLIPCHRVLTSSGGIGGYRWGTGRKRAMLEIDRRSVI